MPDPGPDLRAAMRRFASGVVVVTCQAGGVDHAMTASAFTSVSLDPPLVLVCVDREARFAAAITKAEQWGVSIMSQQGQAAAQWLSTSGRRLEGQLDQVPHRRGVSGVALLTQSLAQMECRTEEVVAAGDHYVVVGRVQRVDLSENAEPLLYWNRDYRQLV